MKPTLSLKTSNGRLTKVSPILIVSISPDPKKYKTHSIIRFQSGDVLSVQGNKRDLVKIIIKARKEATEKKRDAIKKKRIASTTALSSLDLLEGKDREY